MDVIKAQQIAVHRRNRMNPNPNANLDPNANPNPNLNPNPNPNPDLNPNPNPHPNLNPYLMRG